MQSHYDKVLIMRDEQGDVKGVIINDVLKHSKQFYKVRAMDMDEIQQLVSPGQIPNASYYTMPKRKPKAAEEVNEQSS